MNANACMLIVDDEPNVRLMLRTASSRPDTASPRPATASMPWNGSGRIALTSS